MAQHDLAELRYSSTDRRAASVDAMLVAALGRYQSNERPPRASRSSLKSPTQRSSASPVPGGRGIISGLESDVPARNMGPTEGEARAMIVGVLMAAWIVTQLLLWWQPDLALMLG